MTAKIRILIAGCAVLAASAAIAAAPKKAAAPTGSGHWQNPQELYDKVCGRCHETGVGPVIRGRQLPPEQTKLMARNGFGAMPAFTHAMIDDPSLDRLAKMIAKSKAPATKGN